LLVATVVVVITDEVGTVVAGGFALVVEEDGMAARVVDMLPSGVFDGLVKSQNY
jgi:hypothetical protein